MTTTDSQSMFPGTVWRGAVIFLATVGLLVAGYLYLTSLTSHGPLGCGEESGCGAVLSSRWSHVFGVPVSLPAALTYVAVIVAAISLPKSSSPKQLSVWLVLAFLAITILLAAVWFVGLQIFELGEICPWCMTEHGVGTICALLILIPAIGYVRRPELPFGSGQLMMAAVGGLVAMCGLVACQFVMPHSGPEAERVAMQGTVEGSGTGRTISILGDQHKLTLSECPVLGNPDSENIVIVLFDYCCPHCRATHGYLKTALNKYPEQIGVVMLPMPLNSKCNSSWTKDSDRFVESCELAKLALSVWKVAPEHFATFDNWLFESETPRTFANATAYASELLSEEQSKQLPSAIDYADATIKRDVSLYVDSAAERIPVLISPKFDAVVGRPGSEKELLEILEQELNLGGESKSIGTE